MDLSSYAGLAVRLVNTDGGSPDNGDRLTGLDALRSLVADMPHLSGRVTRNDLDVLRMLRAALRSVFAAAARGDGAEAVRLLNELLIQHPVHPQISDHDGQRWHLHLTDSGSVAGQYAAGAVMGLAVLTAKSGLDRLGICGAASCRSVFVDSSSNRSRRYCSDRCANRSSVAAYRARQRDDGAADPPTADLQLTGRARHPRRKVRGRHTWRGPGSAQFPNRNSIPADT